MTPPRPSAPPSPADLLDRLAAEEANLGDTIWASTCVIVVDSIRTVRDSVISQRLGPDFVAYQPILNVRDRFDPTRWFKAHLVIVYRRDQPVGGKGFEIPELKVKLDAVSVNGNRVGINVFENEFVVMQGIVFPGINILWIGCVLMALGTGMAVWQRLKRKAA